MPRLSILILLSVVFGSYWCSPAFGGNDRLSPASERYPVAAADVIPFKLVRGHLIAVKCSLGGLTNLTAILDTGASETVVDMALVHRLSLAVAPDTATFIARQTKVWSVELPGLRLGPVTAARLQGIATDLSSLTAELGISPQVLIGMDFLHRSNFLIDYRSRRLVFAPALPFEQLSHRAPLLTPDSDAYKNSDLRFAMIEASVAGKTFRLQIDSGFDGLLLYRDRVPFPASLRNRNSQVANIGSTLMAESSEPTEVEIGGWSARDRRITVVESPPPAGPEFDGVIGTAFLSKGRVAFDFQNAAIYWD